MKKESIVERLEVRGLLSQSQTLLTLAALTPALQRRISNRLDLLIEKNTSQGVGLDEFFLELLYRHYQCKAHLLNSSEAFFTLFKEAKSHFKKLSS